MKNTLIIFSLIFFSIATFANEEKIYDYCSNTYYINNISGEKVKYRKNSIMFQNVEYNFKSKRIALDLRLELPKVGASLWNFTYLDAKFSGMPIGRSTIKKIDGDEYIMQNYLFRLHQNQSDLKDLKNHMGLFKMAVARPVKNAVKKIYFYKLVLDNNLKIKANEQSNFNYSFETEEGSLVDRFYTPNRYGYERDSGYKISRRVISKSKGLIHYDVKATFTAKHFDKTVCSKN